MKQRLGLLLAAILIVGVSIGGYFYSKSKGQPAPVPTPKLALNLSVLKPIPVASLPNKQKSVSFSFAFTPQQFPTVVPIYKTNKKDIVIIGKNLAQEFGFSGDPQIVQGIHNVYLWRYGGNSFSAQDYPFGISLSMQAPPGGTLPGTQDAQAVVLAFMQKHRLIDPAVQMVLTGSNLLSTSEVNIEEATIPTLADRMSVSYQYQLGGYPVFSQAGGGAGVSALIGPGGNIRSISADVLPTVSTQTSATLLPIEYATVALQNNKGVLVNIDRPGLSEASVADISFSAVSITSANLGYVVLDSVNSIQPIYVFRGFAQNTSGDSGGARVTYFVPAIIP